MNTAKLLTLLLILFNAINVATARTLIEVEQKSTKGCKLVYLKDVTKEDNKKLERLEWTGTCKGGYAEGEGSATEKWSNGDTSKTVATFRRGYEEGQVTKEGYSAGNGVKMFFRGNCSHGMPNGDGEQTFIHPNGNAVKYKGNFADGLPEGQGRMETPQWIYTGEFREQAPSGSGRFEYPNKFVYEGEVRYGKQNGKGKMTFPSGAVLIGYFSDDKPPSSGRIEYPNGAAYEGELEKGNANGKGRMTYLDRSSYYGEFKNGKPEGDGVGETPDGRRVTLTVTDGKFTRRYTESERQAISKQQEQRQQQQQQQQQSNDDSWGRLFDGIAAGINATTKAQNEFDAAHPPPQQVQQPQVCVYDEIGNRRGCYANIQTCIQMTSGMRGYQCH